MGGPRREKTDAEQLQALLLWAREHRIVLGTVTLGSVSVTVTDLGMEAPARRDLRAGRSGGILRKFAGPYADELKQAGLADDADGEEAAIA